MAAVKSKKDTTSPVKKTPVKKAAAKKTSTEIDSGSKRKRVSFSNNKAEPANKKKATATKKVVVKEELESSDEEEEEVKQEVEEEEELTEEQEEAFRKEILGDIASSSEGEDSSDEENDDIEGNKDIVALDGKKLEESMSETKKTFDKKAKASKATKTEEKGVIYLGRIPHGFYENEMKGYFRQFGDISRLRLARNKKTGRSKHYAFIEFESDDVAQIVAETMNNYLLFEHMLKCQVVPADKVHEKLFAGCEKVYKPFNYELRNRKFHNQKMTTEQLEVKHAKLKKTEERLREQIKKAGIEYDFPSFA